MTNEWDNQISERASRLRDVERLSGSVIDLRTGSEPVPVKEAPTSLVPAPRRSRVFLRHGEGHGAFAEMTLTAPRRRHTTP